MRACVVPSRTTQSREAVVFSDKDRNTLERLLPSVKLFHIEHQTTDDADKEQLKQPRGRVVDAWTCPDGSVWCHLQIYETTDSSIWRNLQWLMKSDILHMGARCFNPEDPSRHIPSKSLEISPVLEWSRGAKGEPISPLLGVSSLSFTGKGKRDDTIVQPIATQSVEDSHVTPLYLSSCRSIPWAIWDFDKHDQNKNTNDLLVQQKIPGDTRSEAARSFRQDSLQIMTTTDPVSSSSVVPEASPPRQKMMRPTEFIRGMPTELRSAIQDLTGALPDMKTNPVLVSALQRLTNVTTSAEKIRDTFAEFEKKKNEKARKAVEGLVREILKSNDETKGFVDSHLQSTVTGDAFIDAVGSDERIIEACSDGRLFNKRPRLDSASSSNPASATTLQRSISVGSHDIDISEAAMENCYKMDRELVRMQYPSDR